MNKIKTYISKEAEFLGFGEKKFHKFGFTQSQKWSTCEYSIKGYENKIKIYNENGLWCVDYKRQKESFKLLSHAKKWAITTIEEVEGAK